MATVTDADQMCDRCKGSGTVWEQTASQGIYSSACWHTNICSCCGGKGSHQRAHTGTLYLF